MAKTNTPFLSLAATGTIGRAITSQRWKNRRVLRSHCSPPNSPSPAQLAQRSRVGYAVNAWKQYLTAPLTRAAWELYAPKIGRLFTGYSIFQKLAIETQATIPDPAYVSAFRRSWDKLLYVDVKSLITGTVPTFHETLYLYRGTTPDNLEPWAEMDSLYGTYAFYNAGVAGETYYWQLWADTPRSGIRKMTILGDPTNILVNPSFTTDTDWLKAAGLVTIHDGHAYATSSPVSQAYIRQLVPSLTTHRYRTRFTIISITPFWNSWLVIGNHYSPWRTIAGTYTWDITVSNVALKYCGLGANYSAAGKTAVWDDVYLGDFSEPLPEE